MSSLLIIYLVSVVLAAIFCAVTLYSQWENGGDIDIQDALASVAIILTPVFNTIVVLMALAEYVTSGVVIIKGKEK